MAPVSRRRFLQLGVGATAASLLTPSIARAVAIEGSHRTRSIRDVEHIVVLMQENRSFDHYFGTMRGVRGYGDSHPVTLPTGKSVLHQPDGSQEVLPFHPDVANTGLAFLEDLDHSWDGGHNALNHGLYDQWIAPVVVVMDAATAEVIEDHPRAGRTSVLDHCSFAGAVLDLLSDPTRRSAARAAAKTFPWERSVRSMREIHAAAAQRADVPVAMPIVI